MKPVRRIALMAANSLGALRTMTMWRQLARAGRMKSMSGFGKRVHIAVRHWQASGESALADTKVNIRVIAATSGLGALSSSSRRARSRRCLSGDAVGSVGVRCGVCAHRADVALHLELGDRGGQRRSGRARAVGRACAGRSTSALATTGRPRAAARQSARW